MKCYDHQDQEAVGVCTSCGKNICANCAMEVGGKIVCKSCAQNIANNNLHATSAIATNHKMPLLAAILSFFVPGLGQVYNGQTGKGIALFIGAIVSVALILVVCGAFTYLAIWIYSMYDGYVVADQINKGLIKI